MGDRLGVGDRVDQAVKLKIRVVPQLAQHIFDGGASDELIGQEDTVIAEASGDLDLMRCGERHRPGAIVQLKIEQRRTHGRLAMRRDHGASIRQKSLHPCAVVTKCALLDHGDRERQVFAQDSPVLRADRCERYRTV